MVAFGEDHSFPLPEWAAALLDRHEEPWAVVGPLVRNANPRTATSWADFLLGYAPFADGGGGGEVAESPGHNSSYKRALLERHADGLVTAMAAEWVFHGRLRAQGERVYLEPRAITRHVNFALPRFFLTAKFRAARLGRARCAPHAGRGPRRLVYCGGSVILPALRLARLLRGWRPRSGRRCRSARVLPMLLAGLVVDAAGQAAGFVARTSEPARDADLELERVRYVPAADRAALP